MADLSQFYIAWAKVALGPNWPSYNYTDAQLVSIGQGYYNSLPTGNFAIQTVKGPVFNAPVLSASDPSVGGMAIPGTSGLSFKNPS